MPIGEVFLAAFLPVLFEKLSSPLISELGNLYRVNHEIAKLNGTLKRLQAMLRGVEQKKEVVKGEYFTLWVRELQHIANAIEDVMGELEYEGLRRDVKSSLEGRHGACGDCLFSSSRKLSKFCSCLSPHAISFRCKLARKIDDIRRRLDEITKEGRDLDIGGGINVAGNQEELKRSRETTAILVHHEVFGREKVKNQLIDFLLTTASHVGAPPSSPYHPICFSVLSIVGMGGLGKTTLAKLVYNTEQVQEHFPIRIWLFVSQNFDLIKQAKDILQQLPNPQPTLQNIHNLHILQQDLSEKLKGKRFLLVLDDVWEEDKKKWEEFIAPLTTGGKGSKVLITTRNANVASTLTPERIELKLLSFDDSWLIFKKHAFTITNSGNYQILEPIGKKIVERLNGIPLAAAAIGGLLGSESDERKWRDVLENELWKSEPGGDDILPALKLSYEYLPFHLKQCFTYCSVFPKGMIFHMMDLVQLWIAQGYVPQQGNRATEDVGKDCIKELLSKSIIQFENSDNYFIHDLLHDLGQQVLKHEYHRLQLDQVQEIPEDAHSKIHLMVDYPKPHEGKMEVLYKFKSLRTLLFWFCDSANIEVPIDLFYTLKCLRVLDLSYANLDTLPDSVGCLKHLRYIDVSNTNIECLPESLCALYKLQTLRLDGCEKLNTLPSGMSNLVNLHYLEAKTELISKISQIGKLKHLQYLKVFSISDENKNKVGDLKNMKELRGTLCIQNLERVNTREEAAAARLENLQYLESLEMQWANSQHVRQTSNCPADSVIEGLQPPPSLKELTIKYYPGISIPRWMNNVSIFSLGSLHLHKCTNLNSFSPLGQLHFLRTLHIIGCAQLNELSQLPPALENLVVQEVGLVVLSGRLHHLPLQHVILCQIPELKQLPLLPFTLRELAIEGVGLQALPELSQGCGISMTTTTTTARGSYIDEDKSNDYLGVPALSTLKIHTCPHLTTLDGGLLKQQHLRHLKVLSIKHCVELVNWPEGGGFQSTLYSLADELSIESCPKLAGFPEGTRLNPSLKKLVVKGSPMVPNRLMLGQVHNVDDVDVDMCYPNLEQCANEALQHIFVVEQLKINVEYQVDDDVGLGAPPADGKESPVLFVYDKRSNWDYRVMDEYMARQVELGILQERRRRGGGCQQAAAYGDNNVVVSTDEDGDEKYHYDYDDNWCPAELLWRRLRGLPWTSSLRHLALANIPGRELMISRGAHDPHSLSPPLPSLQELCIFDCSELRRLPTEMMLSHLTGLKILKMVDCPELTWSSVDVGTHSLPSLEYLMIMRCPMLLETMPPQPPPSSSPKKMVSNNSTTVDREDVRSSPPPAGLPRLRYLWVDDLKILTQWLLVDQNILTSLRALVLHELALTSLTPADERALRTLAPSLQLLRLHSCPNLKNLPADLRSLLPKLKVLDIADCPKLRHLPAEELPELLEVLEIHECPEMKEKLANARRHKQLDLLRIPVWIIDGEYQTGSYSMFQELRAKWDFRIPFKDEGLVSPNTFIYKRQIVSINDGLIAVPLPSIFSSGIYMRSVVVELLCELTTQSTIQQPTPTSQKVRLMFLRCTGQMIRKTHAWERGNNQ